MVDSVEEVVVVEEVDVDVDVDVGVDGHLAREVGLGPAPCQEVF